MNIFLLLLIIAPDNRLNTSFYTFHKVGGYSVSDLYLNYVISRYGFNLVMEKRQFEFGMKSVNAEIDSVLGRFRLTLGEKQYHVTSPLGMTLDLWGIALCSNDLDLFIGKTKDQTTALPPTFRNNNYTFGLRLARNFSYRAPVEFYLIKKNDSRGRITSSNSFGVNAKVKIMEGMFFFSQLGASFSSLGFGASFSTGLSYAGQKYGFHTYFRNIERNYVTPACLQAEPENFFLWNSYVLPLEWLSIGQEISYSSAHDINIGLNFAVNKSPLPEFGYGFGISARTGQVSQNVHTGWHYRKFSISADYGWLPGDNSFSLKLTQDIKSLQIWTQFQFRNAQIYQIGTVIPLSTKIMLKSHFNFVRQNAHTSSVKGCEIALKIINNLNIHATYEWISQGNWNDHNVSLSLSNSLLFDQVGFGFITGKVFMDVNSNGVFDNNDQVVSDVELILDGREKVRTDAKGNYKFSFIRSGKHTVNLNLGCLPAEIGSDKRQETVDTRFMSRANVHFPLTELGIIEGHTFYDDNKNGIMDNGETGASNIVIGLNGFLTTSDGAGKFRFANLMGGTYALDIKVLPPETFLTNPGITYIQAKPGKKLSNYQVGIVRKERPVQVKKFEEPPIVEPKKPVVKPKPKPVEKLSSVDIENLFNKGVAYFIANQYKQALKAFNEILALDPGHKGAREYKKRTEARLEALRQ